MLAPRFPYPPLGGDRQFLLHAARALREFRITLLSFCATREEMEYEPADDTFAEIHRVFLPKWRSVHNVLPALSGCKPLQLAYYWSRAFQARVKELLPQHDIVLAHLIRTAQYVAGAELAIPRVLLMSDAISLTYARMSGLTGTSRLWRLLYRTEFDRLFAYERACAAQFDQVWMHSEVDRQFLGLDAKRVRIVPMGIELGEFPFKPDACGNVIAFVANMSSNMNRDACFHFIRDILPRLRRNADMRLRVIGACPEEVQRELLRHPGVEVTGTVRRIADAVSGVFCGVCPVRGGAGIQNKVLNYMALGLPCVTSQIGLEGIPAADGRDLFVYRTPEEAVYLILRLHADADLRRKTAAHARRLIVTTFDWTRIYGEMRKEITELIELRRSRAA
jgi:glycosyltransferase involved in cell wall biosynthesis